MQYYDTLKSLTLRTNSCDYKISCNFDHILQLFRFTLVYLGFGKTCRLTLCFKFPYLFILAVYMITSDFMSTSFYIFYSFSYYNRTYKQDWEWRQLTVQVIVSVWFKNPIMHISSSHFIKTTLAEDKEKNKWSLICILPRCISNILSWL